MKRSFLFIGLAWACAAAAWGHGIEAQRVEGGVGVRAVYDDGSPVTFSEAALYAPASGEKPLLTGMTDRDGCFMFRPDTSGIWRITIDDGMGHVVTEEVAVDGKISTSKQKSRRMPKRYGIVTGLALIFGLFGSFAFLRQRYSGKAGG